MELGSPAGSVDEAPAIQADLILAPQCSHQNWALMADMSNPRVGEVETSRSLRLSLPKSLSSRFNERVCLKKKKNKVKSKLGSALLLILPAHTCMHVCMDTPTYEHVHTKEVWKEKGSVVPGGGNYDRFQNIWKHLEKMTTVHEGSRDTEV